MKRLGVLAMARIIEQEAQPCDGGMCYQVKGVCERAYWAAEAVLKAMGREA